MLQNIECYSPQYLGIKDILIAFDKIYKIQPPGKILINTLIEKVIDCKGFKAFPGIIDQHVHIIGGGGENGYISRIPEININEIIEGGITTLVGILGVDGYTKNIENLLAKAKGLEEQGITTYIYTGNYAVPTVTLTGSIINDLVFIDKVIGTGEIAISDHRSSQPNTQEILKLSSQTHIGGILSKKAGVVHFHVGDDKEGLQPLLLLLENSDLPIEQFVPTHVNRNIKLFYQSIEYCRSGGNIDLTSGETCGVPVIDALDILLKSNLDNSKVTISSDANGSIPSGGVSKINTLYDDIKNSILVKNLSPETVFSFVTENVSKLLKIYPKKGTLRECSDADILITDNNFNINKVISMGKIMYDAEDINERGI